MSDRTRDLADLLSLDVDIYDAMATEATQRQRNELLQAAMERLVEENDVVARFKVVQLSRALLAATEEEGLSPGVVKMTVAALSIEAAADDPNDRLAALRALAVMISRAGSVPSSLASVIQRVFDRARNDSSARIREFADELLAPGGLLSFRVGLEHVASSERATTGKS